MRKTQVIYQLSGAESMQWQDWPVADHGDGVLTTTIHAEYALKDAVHLHEDFEGGKTPGSLVLLP